MRSRLLTSERKSRVHWGIFGFGCAKVPSGTAAAQLRAAAGGDRRRVRRDLPRALGQPRARRAYPVSGGEHPSQA